MAHGPDILYNAFVYGIVGGIFALVIHLFRKPKKKACEFCKEKIHADATFCKHCHKDQPPVVVVPKEKKPDPKTAMIQRKDGSVVYVSRKDFKENFDKFYNSKS